MKKRLVMIVSSTQTQCWREQFLAIRQMDGYLCRSDSYYLENKKMSQSVIEWHLGLLANQIDTSRSIQ
jgi:hypothetical protein